MLSVLVATMMLGHTFKKSPDVAIPTSLPGSGQLATPALITKQQLPTTWHTVSLSTKSSHQSPILVKQVRSNTKIAMVYVCGSMKPNTSPALKDVWVKVTQLAKQASEEKSWVYDVSIGVHRQFHSWLSLPFGQGRYLIAIAPPLETAQTSVTKQFDQKEQVLTQPFILNHVKADNNQQFGMLSSVWANWLNPQIEVLAQKITAHAVNPLEKVKDVYEWEAANINYDFQEISKAENYRWNTTQETLATRQGICVDYSNVADALLRAKGIPTQMLIGRANDYGATVADNGNVGHSWNRSYVDGHWIYFDPTWSRIYLSHTQYVIQNRWFNPPVSLFNRTHQMVGIQFQ